jgi:hypothetical protein
LSVKKIAGLFLKILIGAGSFGVIYWRLKGEFSGEHAALLRSVFTNHNNLLYVLLAALLFPLNWFLESIKWKWITHQVEPVSISKAQKSVYAGVCVGNLAPGRATEFLAKIHFFQPKNRLAITILHFLNGMFQLSVTIIMGMLGIFLKVSGHASDNKQIQMIAIILSVIVMLLFLIALFNINRILEWLYKRFSAQNYEELKAFEWNATLLFKLFSVSLIRYAVFTVQFLFILSVFPLTISVGQMLLSVWIYFLFTTIIPMFSLIEAAVRAAIAMVVFTGLGLSNSSLAAIAILVWMINIVLPSVIGYFILVRENLTLKSFKLREKKLPIDEY